MITSVYRDFRSFKEDGFFTSSGGFINGGGLTSGGRCGLAELNSFGIGGAGGGRWIGGISVAISCTSVSGASIILMGSWVIVLVGAFMRGS